jgi:hypothetical protein
MWGSKKFLQIVFGIGKARSESVPDLPALTTPAIGKSGVIQLKQYLVVQVPLLFQGLFMAYNV